MKHITILDSHHGGGIRRMPRGAGVGAVALQPSAQICGASACEAQRTADCSRTQDALGGTLRLPHRRWVTTRAMSVAMVAKIRHMARVCSVIILV